MNLYEMTDLAMEERFSAVAVIEMDKVVFEPGFRPYCEQNLCGQYGANYSCPPDCGMPEEMENQLRRYSHALVFQTKWDIDDWYDEKAIHHAKQSHNDAMFRVIDRLKAKGIDGKMAGASRCTLCKRCTIIDGIPCVLPDRRFSCLSAYCLYVKKLADSCGMEYSCTDGSLTFFGLFAFDLK